jgi:hypothetical protein
MEFVFLQAQAEGGLAPLLTRASFWAREVSGLLSGAAQAHLMSLFGMDGWIRCRRFNMRPQFRFPRSTVFMMFVILAGVLLTIEKAKTIQVKYEPGEVMAVWNSLPWFLFLFPALACAAVVAVWAVLFALHRTGMHRLDGVRVWPEQK